MTRHHNSFQPKREAAFKERLVLGSGANSVRYLMVGHGVSPVFSTEGLVDCSSLNADGRIDLGDVLKGAEVLCVCVCVCVGA